MTYYASRFWSGMLSWTKLFKPDSVELQSDCIKIVKHTMLGLKSSEEEMKYNNIASVRLAKNLFTSDIIIETTGGAISDLSIKKLRKNVGNEVVGKIRSKIEVMEA